MSDPAASPWEAIRRRLGSGCSVQEFAVMRCPVCAAELLLAVHPSRPWFFVRCREDTTHLAMHGRGDPAPPWWGQHREGGWITDPR